jgi:predicted RNase H-like HicB family nuclease
MGQDGTAAGRPAISRTSSVELPMHNEFTAVIERDEEWFIAYCPEIPGANGQGLTKEECVANLAEAIELILEDRREDALRGLPDDAVREVVSIG